MLNYNKLKKELIDKNISFQRLVEKDGRSRQYLFRECKKGNQKVLERLFQLLRDF